MITALAVLAAALLFGAVRFLVPEFGGFDDALFPIPQPDAPVQPAGYAFLIWGVIYLALVLSAAFGVVFRANTESWQPMRLPLTLSLLMGAAWLPVAQMDVLAATALIWGMLGTALWALFLAPIEDRWLARIPLSIYAGWLSVASFVAIGLVLAGWGLMSDLYAALLALSLAVVFTAIAQYRLGGAPFYGLTVLWALIAIIVANGADQLWVSGLAGFGVLVMLRGTGRAFRKALAGPA